MWWINYRVFNDTARKDLISVYIRWVMSLKKFILYLIPPDTHFVHEESTHFQTKCWATWNDSLRFPWDFSVVQLLLLFYLFLGHTELWQYCDFLLVCFVKQNEKCPSCFNFKLLNTFSKETTRLGKNEKHKVGESGEMSYWLAITVISFLLSAERMLRKLRWCFSLFLPVDTINLWGQWISPPSLFSFYCLHFMIIYGLLLWTLLALLWIFALFDWGKGWELNLIDIWWSNSMLMEIEIFSHDKLHHILQNAYFLMELRGDADVFYSLLPSFIDEYS